MKICKKIISGLLSAALLGTAMCGINVSAAENKVTASEIKALAESRKLSDTPYLNQILEAEYNPDYDRNILKEHRTIGDVADAEHCYEYIHNAWYITRFFMEGTGTAKSFDEACTQYNSNVAKGFDYFMPTELHYDEFGNSYNALMIQVSVDDEGKAFSYMYPDCNIFVNDDVYASAAKLINSSDIGTPKSVWIFDENQMLGVETEKGCYMITFKEWTNDYAPYLGKATDKLEVEHIYTVAEFNNYYSGFRNDEIQARKKFGTKLHEAMPEAPTRDDCINIQKSIQDTDSFSKYIGTEPKYSDIDKSRAAVTNQLTDIGVITGVDGNFYPDNKVTRAEAAAMLCRLFDIEPKLTDKFSDVPDTHWAAGYIGALFEEGIIGGVSEGVFAPDSNVTYEQIFKMAEALLGLTFDKNIWMHGEYPTGMIMVAAELGLSDDLGSFDSGADISRIELACVLSRVLDSHLVTEHYYIYEFGLHGQSFTDITLSEYKNGGKLHGKLLRSDDAKMRYDAELSEIYAEKCGAVIDEFSHFTGINQEKKMTGGVGNVNYSGNPKPRITQ